MERGFMSPYIRYFQTHIFPIVICALPKKRRQVIQHNIHITIL